jgi:hypothetical protein
LNHSTLRPVLDYEPSNKTAKDFYPQLLAKVNEQHSSSSEGSDENCNYTSSLEFVDNGILDNDHDMDNISQSSSITSSISSNEEGSDMSSNEDEMDQPDQEDLINSLSHSSSRSSNLSKSEQLPESMSSTSSNNRENTSHSFSFTSLLLDDSDDVNNDCVNNNVVEPPAKVVDAPVAAPSSPFTSKIMQMFKGKWDAASPSKHN